MDAYSGYDAQTTCRTAPMPGTAALARWLQAQYPSTGSLGMLRSCGVSGTSEHKDGRAFDWAADVAKPATRRAAYDFIVKALATDSAGNRNALARRLGIMYFIYDDKIWASYRDFEPRPYLHSACRVLAGCSRTLRHLDHVHISLGLAGAAAQTSWYRARGVPSVPVYLPGTVQLDPDETAVTSFTAPADGATHRSSFKLAAGVTYRVVVSGLVRTGAGAAVSDANCQWVPQVGWQPSPRGALPPSAPSAGSGRYPTRYGSAPVHPASAAASPVPQTRALLVRGAVRWESPERCQDDHTYEAWVTPDAVQRLTVRFADATPGDNDGAFSVYVARDDITRHSLRTRFPAVKYAEPKPWRAAHAKARALVRETVAVNTARRLGTLSDRALVKGRTYRIRVSGMATDRATGLRFDGACVRYDGHLRRQHSLDLTTPDADHFSVYVSGVKVALHPVGRASGCTGARGHVYVATFVAPASGRTRVRVWDPYDYTDNTGTLSVRLTRR